MGEEAYIVYVEDKWGNHHYSDRKNTYEEASRYADERMLGGMLIANVIELEL